MPRHRIAFVETGTMAESDKSADKPAGGGAATLKPKLQRKTRPRKKPPGHLPLWKVLLHNDDKNDMVFVVETIVALTPLDANEAVQRMTEAHKTGVALLLVTHKERAELYMEQFASKGLTVTIEQDDD